MVFVFKSRTVPRNGQCRPRSAPAAPGTVGRVRPLHVSGCRSECSWADTGSRLGGADGEPLFTCAGCGSEWVPSEAWTPVDWTGAVPEAVQRVRRAERGAG